MKTQEKINDGTPKKKRRTIPRLANDEIAEALRLAYGIIAKAAAYLSKKKSEETGQDVKYERSHLSRRIHSDEKLAAVLEEAPEGMLDTAEDILFQKIREGDMTAIIFFLKCKGKKRGYIERQALELSGQLQTEIKNDAQRIHLDEQTAGIITDVLGRIIACNSGSGG
jgi:hypothetical protein